MWWWGLKVHRSWLVAGMSSGFVGGVALVLVFRVHGVWGLIAFAVCVMCFVFSRRYSVPIACVSSVVAGLGYGSVQLVARDVYAVYFEKTVMVSGRIKEDPSFTASGTLSWQLDDVRLNGNALPGTLYAGFRGKSQAKRGDYIAAKAEVAEGFGSFAAKLSVTTLTKVTRPVPGDIGRVVRDWFADQVRKVIPEPQASLGIGFLTGQKSALPGDLAEALKIAGLTHIVVASGYNLTILVRMARKLFLRLSKYVSAVSASCMILAFVAITGLSPSMTRAGLVSGMSLAAWYYGHAFHPLVLLPFAAAITVLLQPSYVWGDLGWQLSFAAFAGVMIVSPLLQCYFFGTKEPGVVRQILGETIAAHAVTVPIIAISFGTVSNVAIIANILVVPLVPLAMLLTFMCGLGAVVSIGLIAWLAIPTTWLLGYMTQVATFVAELPWAQSAIELPLLVWGVYVVLLGGACLWMQKATGHSFASSGSQQQV
jgi:competence protein ComEC